MRAISFGPLLLTLLSCAVAAADEKADVRALLDKAIAASGGESRLAKHVALHVKFNEVVLADNKTFPANVEIYMQGLDKARRSVLYETTKTLVVEVVNGKSGWIKRGDGDAQIMTDERLAAWREVIYLTRIEQLFPLRNREFDLSPVDEVTVEGRPAVGLLVRRAAHEAVKLYFDKESHLLVKSRTRTMDVSLGREIVNETISLDYRTVNGETHSFKHIRFRDDVKRTESTMKLREYFDKPLDDKLFDKP
jgi:hypothetical protein